MNGAPAKRATLAFPLAFGHWSVRSGTLVCRLPRKTVRVQAPGRLLDAVLDLCDGRTGWAEVEGRLGRDWAPQSVRQFLAQLSVEGAIVEAGESLARWTGIGQVPGLYPRAAGGEEVSRLHGVALARLLPGAGEPEEQTAAAQALRQLLQARESHRTFEDAALPMGALNSVLWAAHGVARAAADPGLRWHRTVASGGNMHSSRWFVFVLRELPAAAGQRGAVPGVCEVRFHVEGGVSLEPVHGRWTDAWRILADPRVLQFASALLVPVHEAAVPARKYGNRAALFAHIEAGQSLQNAQLMAAAVGAAAMVRGDTVAESVLDSLLSRAGASPRQHWLPMPSLVIGMPASERQRELQKADRNLTVGTASALPGAPGLRSESRPFAFVVSAGLAGQEVHGTGRATDPKLALRKAQAEAWERLGWATLGPAEEGTQKDFQEALDPRAFVAYTARQLARPGFPLQPFSARRKYLWRSGVDAASGAAVRLPAECVHALHALPAPARRRACASISTSGVAAWTDGEGALCRATLELLERDAFVRSWLAGIAPPLLAIASLPGDAARRVAWLQASGHRVAIARLANAWVPVYSVFVQSSQRPFTAITAAADFDPQHALDKALDEAEGRAAQAAAFPAEPLRSAGAVESVADVNRYYQTPRFFRRADFHASGTAAQRFDDASPASCRDWPGLKAALATEGHRILAFDLTPADAALDQGRTPLRVVRACIPGLLPIWFQAGLAPAGLDGFQAALGATRSRAPSRFIHPFT